MAVTLVVRTSVALAVVAMHQAFGAKVSTFLGRNHRAAAKAEASWGYGHPDEWKDKYPACKGHVQSPIDIDVSEVARNRDVNQTSLLELSNYSAIPQRFIRNTGHGLQVMGDFGSLHLPDGEYKVKQFHFHFPAEHAVNNMLAAGELHVVHQNPETGALAVIGIMLQDTKHMAADVNASERRSDLRFLHQLGFNSRLPHNGEKLMVNGTVDLNAFSRELAGPFYHYKGSLTTPPCSENVHWYVMDMVAGISPEQIEAFQEAHPAHNNRPVQPDNGRVVVSSTLEVPGEYDSSKAYDPSLGVEDPQDDDRHNSTKPLV